MACIPHALEIILTNTTSDYVCLLHNRYHLLILIYIPFNIQRDKYESHMWEIVNITAHKKSL